MSEPRESPQAGPPRAARALWAAVALLLGLAGAASAVAVAIRLAGGSEVGGLRWALDGARTVTALAASGWALRRLSGRGRAAGWPPRGAFPVRLLLYGALASVGLPSLLAGVGWVDGDDPVLHAWSLAGLVAGPATVTLALCAAPRLARGPRSRAGRAADLLLFNLVATLLAVELGLLVMQRYFPSQILWDDSSAARSILGLRRCEGHDGTPLFEYRCNSRGYPDEEFFAAGKRDYVVAVLADSFGPGSVPWEYHFATLAERELRAALASRCARVAVHNFGVNGAGMPEYKYLLDTEVLEENPAQVVLALFVGNDVEGLEKPAERRRVRRHVLVQRWLAPEVLVRLRRISRGLERVTVPFERGYEPPFLTDPSLEPPFFTEAQFLDIERDRMEICATRNHPTEQRFAGLFRGLDAFHEILGDRLLVMVIPDEFQVNDELWERLLDLVARNPLYVRDYPQQKIAGWCEARGARCLDLLPALRLAERDDRTYHLRDTHWNARGNRVAAQELTRELLAYARTAGGRPPSCAAGAAGR